jgi:hypothetical protein
MGERLSFSGQEQTLEEVAAHHTDVQAGLFEFFAGNSQTLLDRYAGARVDEARERALSELDLTSSLSVLSSVEAALRLDYLYRVYDRWRDPLSRAMRALHRNRGSKARLDEDLIRLWRDTTDVPNVLLNELVGALNYRDWLAHGRYWEPKLGRRYDYQTVYEIAQEFIEAMDKYNTAYDRGNLSEI